MAPSGSERASSSSAAATPVVSAAREILGQRLSDVRECLSGLQQKPHRRRQLIHRLRVATRRATAAIDVFSDCLPKRVREDARSRLGSLRKAVATARDCDVLLEELAESAPTIDMADRPTHEMLTGWCLARRVDAEAGLKRAARDCSPRDMQKLQARVIDAVRWRAKHPPTFARFARPVVHEQLAAFISLAEGDNASWQQLHEVRITGKRLRYTLELLACGLDPAVTEAMVPALVTLQEVLGSINDAFTASQLLQDILRSLQAAAPAAASRYHGSLTQAIAHYQQRMEHGRQTFTNWLDNWRAMPEWQAVKR